MSKKKSLANIATGSNMSRADYDLTRMKYPDLKRACIARGMPFEEASCGSIPKLSSWFVKNYDRGQDLTLLDEYDAWFETEALSRGYKKGDAILHSDLRMGFIATVDDTTKKKPRLGNKGLKKKEKKKRERVEGLKILSGTKKAMTYECQMKGISLSETMKLVMEKFPEAKDKSIKIWYQRSIKGE